jgi:hypothetical protein
MSSHSAVTLIPHDREKIRFVDISDNAVNCYEVPKRVAIQRLSKDLIRYSEREKLLSIFRTIQIKKKPVLFTEGHTDVLILSEAWQRIYSAREIPFIPLYAFSHTYLRQLLADEKIYEEMGRLPIFALFDFDEAYNSWKGLKWKEVEGDPFNGLISKCETRNAYAIMLPVAQHEDIVKQVIKDQKTKKTYGGESLCCIEHLFYGITETAHYFKKEPCPGGGSKVVFKSDSLKTKFAEEVVQALPDECFQPLKPVFDFIADKCKRHSAIKTGVHSSVADARGKMKSRTRGRKASQK